MNKYNLSLSLSIYIYIHMSPPAISRQPPSMAATAADVLGDANNVHPVSVTR